MLSETRLEHILTTLPRLRIAVVGDLFLDRYLDVDAALSEPSIETGLDAYQVTRVRSCPGAAGTVINNLAALGVGMIVPLAVIGDDGEGYELRQALAALPAVRPNHLIIRGERRTPTYTKPMMCQPGAAPRELNRLDIKNRQPMPADAENGIITALAHVWPSIDALLVLDQVSEANCGVITDKVRAKLEEMGAGQPGKWILADSRERIGLFQNVCLKPNAAECHTALGRDVPPEQAAAVLARRCGRAVFCTAGAEGIWIGQPDQESVRVPAPHVDGPLDTVGAGDATNAGLASALAAGATLEEAATFANIVASITIQQVGTTGTATPGQARERWRDHHGRMTNDE